MTQVPQRLGNLRCNASLPTSGNNLLQHGVSISNSASMRLQEVEIQYLEDTFLNQVVNSSSKPSSSRIPASERLSLPALLSSSPIRTLSEDQLHVSLRLGGLPESDPVEDVPPMAAQKKRRGRPPSSAKSQVIPKAPPKAATKKPASNKRVNCTSIQGVSLKKRRVSKVQSSPCNRHPGGSGTTAVLSPNETTDNTQDLPTPARLIPATSKHVVDFRTPPNALP